MTSPLPSLALEMSMDGISLHQLAFDGHWHELSRVGLNDAALREKMANMREIAQRLEGRRFKVRVWLPADQILRKETAISDEDPKNREIQARQILDKITPQTGADFAIALNTPPIGDPTWLAAARHKTMREAFAFAKSHGFNATSYSTKDAVEGFVDKPYFKLPPNRARTIGLGIAAFALIGSVIAAGVGFRISDPYLWWERPPEVVEFAPFQNPDLALDRSNDNVLPASIARPEITDFASLSARSLREALPYVPTRRLDATAQDFINEPPALYDNDFDVTYSTMPEDARLSLPLKPQNIDAASGADRPPSFGLYNILTTVAQIAAPQIPAAVHATSLPADLAIITPANRPATVANLRFVLEPLPSMAVTTPYELQQELANNFGIDLRTLPTPLPTVLADTQVVQVFLSLPDILPKLRNGNPIPPQVAVLQVETTVTVIETVPADAEAIATAARGFRIVQGRPDIVPARRFVPPPVEEIVVAEIVAQIITQTPDAGGEPPVDIPANIPVDIVPGPDSPTEILAEIPAQTAEIVVATISPIAPAEFTGEIQVVQGRPDRLPVLRSGNAIPDIVAPPIPVAVPDPLDAAIAQALDETLNNPDAPPAAAEPISGVEIANALRAKRRPADLARLNQQIDPMLSDAAPPIAVRPSHRSDASNANAARIAALVSARPEAVVPIVPRDPQTVNLPTTASVARAATIDNGINLRKTALLGIFGSPDARIVLIRLASGRILRVSLGDSFSGWQVVAIGEDSVRIQKGNRTEILRMPN